MIVNEQYANSSIAKNIDQLYADFAELLYDIYVEDEVNMDDENMDATMSQKLE